MQGTGTASEMGSPVASYFRDLFAGREMVLDAGCGEGGVLWDGAVGIDYDINALRVAGHRVVQGDLTDSLPFPDATFDGILAKDIVEHLPDPRSFLAELARVTKPSGCLVLTTPRAIPRAVWADYTHVRGFTKQAVTWLLRDTGWTIEGKPRRMGGVPLAGRLGIVRWLPTLLRVPGFGHYFGTNWQAIATRNAEKTFRRNQSRY